MIICYFCMFFSCILLFITGLQGYFNFLIWNANYLQFGLFTIIFYMFSETLIMFYFIGSGTAIKNEINNYNIMSSSYESVKKTKMKLFPHLTLNIVLMGVVFVLNGAVYAQLITSVQHNILFLISFIHFLYTLQLQHDGFKENIKIIVELAEMKEIQSIVK